MTGKMPPEIFPQRKVFFAYRSIFISGRISGRLSGLAGYQISGRIYGRAYPVSCRTLDIKKRPDIRPDIRLAGYPAYPY